MVKNDASYHSDSYDIDIVDENLNTKATVKPGTNGIYKEGQTVYGYTDKNGNKQWTASPTPEQLAQINAPKVEIKGDSISISAPQQVLDSPLVAQIDKELQTLKGADLKSPDVVRAVDALNKEVKNSVAGMLTQQMYGWSLDEYNDYQRALQTVQSSNPLQSENQIKGEDKDGKVIKMSPQKWVEYYRKNYSTNERADAFRKSLQSKTPYGRTMALVLGQGGDRPVYGFDNWEKLGQFVGAIGNQMMKVPEGLGGLLGQSFDAKRVEDIAGDANLGKDAFSDTYVADAKQFRDRKNKIKGKAWSELSDKDKAFLTLLAVSKESSVESSFQRDLADRTDGEKDIRKMSYDDDMTSRRAISNILENSALDRYNSVRNDYSDLINYERDNDQNDERLAKNAIFSEGEQTIGNIAGVIGRFIWEGLLTKGASKGKVNINATSDKIGSTIVDGLARKGIAPTSALGKGAMKFTADLIGTVPEDILQLSLDNILTNNLEDNEKLLDPKEMSENLKGNLLFMSVFNAGRAGLRGIKNAKIAQQLSKQADLDTKINIGGKINASGIISDADDIAKAANRGGDIKVENGNVSVVDVDGTEKVMKNTTPEMANMAKRSISNTEKPSTQVAGASSLDNATSPSYRVVDENPFPDSSSTAARTLDNQPTTKIEVDTPNGRVLTDVPNYRFNNVSDALKTKISGSRYAVRHWHPRATEVAMRSFSDGLRKFHDKFGDVQVSDFDWVFHNTRNGLQPSQIIGTVDPETGREVTQNMIDAMRWFGDQPFMKDLRKASRDALGLEGDFNMLGYLPHSTYDPSNLSFDEALTGQLWRQYTGASMAGEGGEYRGFGGDFISRYRTFASNMLWDAKAKDVAAAKLVEEAEMDGQTITTEQAVKAVEGQQSILKKVDDASSTKDLENALSSDAEYSKARFQEIEKNSLSQAEKSGLGKASHDNYAEIYTGANTASVVKQSSSAKQAFDTLGNTLRNTQIKDNRGNLMSLYGWGGADLVYAERNAIDIVNRYMREGGDLRNMLIEFIENHSHRTPEYAEEVADRWMKRLNSSSGQITKGDAIRSLSNSMKWEAMGRIRKFLVMAKYDEFNSSTKKMIDRFLFSHMQTDTIKNSKKISKKLTSALDLATGMRYRALFYGNVKNALLQTSELNRLFTTFKWGDVATMAKRMATDANFKARVDDIYDAVAPRQNSFRSSLYNDYAEVAGNMKATQDGVSFKEGGKKMVEAVDNIGLAPIESAEAFKNRMMIAALVQEADSLGLAGDDALRHIRNRFERVALAMDELGQIGLASNPIARTALFLQNFQIRELGMHIYNLSDELFAKNTKVPKRLLNASKYISKVLGTKLATTLIMARLGYSASQTLGYDPFGVLENYTGMDEEDIEGFDYFMKSPLFAGGMTSLISDVYFMARKAYEDSEQKTVSEEAEEDITGESSYGLSPLSFDQLMGLGQGFIPGNVFYSRIQQMNDMMDSGWATSQSGNKMYTAPDDLANTVLGYLFGRGATQNAQQYNQTYGDNLWQTIGRFNPFRDFREFDPIDTKNYSDWFKGDENDIQQFNLGIRHFRNERNNIIDAYEDAVRRGYLPQEEITEAKNNMNQRLEELYDKLERFANAYEDKNGTIAPNMVNQILSVLNTGRAVLGDTEEQAEERSLEDYNEAIERYAMRDFSPVGTYTGPTESNPDKEVKYLGSPQYRAAVNSYYQAGAEAVDVLKQADKLLKPIRDSIKNAVSNAFATKDYDRLSEIQYSYLDEFDNVVSPIIATYGRDILKDSNVTDQLRGMLSTGTKSRTANLIPTEQYKKNKRGRFQSMPYETVDIKKWAQKRFDDKIYDKAKTNGATGAKQDLAEIKRLANSGYGSMAKARAMQLKARVDNQRRSLNSTDYAWLDRYLRTGKVK